MGESKELKSLLMKLKEESEKDGLKLHIKKKKSVMRYSYSYVITRADAS